MSQDRNAVMNAQTKVEAPTLSKLREPFPEHHISKLPKPTKAQTDAVRQDFKKGIRCKLCGSWHHPDVVHLDYVGHAALTDRLLDTDPEWTWEPLALGQNGLPALDSNGGLWIKLTVLGVTRLGYGDAEGKVGGNAIKEAIGDALRNAAMRFGAALDLWHKGDLHPEEDNAPDGANGSNSETRQERPIGPAQGDMPDAEWAKLVQLIEATGSDSGWLCKHYGVKNLRLLNQQQYGDAIENLNLKLANMAKDETDAKVGTNWTEELGDAIKF